MNKIVEKLISSRPVYVHALEVYDAFDLKCGIEDIYDTFHGDEGYPKEVVRDFVVTLNIYCLDDNNEQEVNDFNVGEFFDSLV